MRTFRLNVRGRPTGVHVQMATTHAERMRGLLGRESLPLDQAMLLKPCRAIHTLGMRFAIDVVFLNSNNCVTRAVSAVKPWRLVWGDWRSRATLELAAGWLGRFPLMPGDSIELHPVVNAGAAQGTSAAGR